MTDSLRKRVLLVTRNFPPLTGGMERLNYHIYLELEKEFDVSVAGPDGCQLYLLPKTAFSIFPHKPVGLFLLKSFIATYRLAVKEKPDLIIAGSGVTVIAALIAGRRVGAKVVVFLHGLDIIFPHPIYQFLFLPAIRACDGFLVNSKHTADLARQKRIPIASVYILNPGVTIPKSHELIAEPAQFRKKYSLSDNKKILLSVGRLTERKGLPEFITHCLPAIVSEHPEIALLIIGNDANDALSNQSNSSTKIKQATLETNLENHVFMVGQVSENELTQAYLCSDLLVFPVLDLSGDVEGFGMVALEAAAHGLPTAAFRVGGVADAVDNNKSGWLVNPGDYNELTRTIVSYLKSNIAVETNDIKTVSIQSCKEFSAKFSWDLFGQRLRLIFTKLISV